MKEFKNIDEILDFAINAEQEAVNFYTSLGAKSKNPAMKKVFDEYAQEEMKHKSMLAGVKENRKFEMTDFKIKNIQGLPSCERFCICCSPKSLLSYGQSQLQHSG